jgi:hypothetical protein
MHSSGSSGKASQSSPATAATTRRMNHVRGMSVARARAIVRQLAGTGVVLLRKNALVVLAAIVAAGGLVAMARADGFSAAGFHVGTGQVWEASTGPGQLALLDGASGKVVVKVRVATDNQDLVAVQGSNAGFAVNRTTGSVVRLDDSTWAASAPVQLIGNATAGLAVAATSGVLVAIDRQHGLVTTADPQSLQPRGAARALASAFGSDPVVDKSGNAWTLSNAGDLLRLTDPAGVTAQGIATGATARLVSVNGVVVAVDPAGASVRAIDAGSGTVDRTACLGGDPADPTIQAVGSGSADVVYTVSGRDGSLRATDLASGS